MWGGGKRRDASGIEAAIGLSWRSEFRVYIDSTRNYLFPKLVQFPKVEFVEFLSRSDSSVLESFASFESRNSNFRNPRTILILSRPDSTQIYRFLRGEYEEFEFHFVHIRFYWNLSLFSRRFEEFESILFRFKSTRIYRFFRIEKFEF